MRIAAAMAGMFLAGCTPSAIYIDAAPVSPAVFANMDCGQLRTMIAETQAALVPIVAKQERAAEAQVAATVGFGLTGLAVSGLATQGANNSGTIAIKRGELAAARQAAAQKQCTDIPPVHRVEIRREKREKTPDPSRPVN